ncbi:MAG: hypothetical protein U0841_16955, partial [Chloroflexia bacterium]
TATATVAPTPLPPTATVQPTATVALHANGRIPEGWRIYVGTSVPVVVNYDGGWGVYRQEFNGGYALAFSTSVPGGYAFLNVGQQDLLNGILPTLLERSDAEIQQYFAKAWPLGRNGPFAGTCDGIATFDGVTHTSIAQSDFITLNAHCTYYGIASRLQMFFGVSHDRPWWIFTLAPRASYDDVEKTHFGPMLFSMKFD